MNKKKNKVIVKKNQALYYTELKNICSGNPLPYFHDKDFERMTDMVLNQRENLLLYLTSRGLIGIIELEKSKKQKPFKISSLIGDKSEDGFSKDSTETNYSRYYSLTVTPEDDYVSAISFEKFEGGLSFTVTILKMSYPDKDPSGCFYPILQFSDRKQIVDNRVTAQTSEQRSLECVPQYVNFSIKSKSTNRNILLVFIRGYSKFFSFPIFQGKILDYQTFDLFSSASMLDGGMLVDDGCMIDDTILITLQSHILLKITYKVN